MNNFLINFLIGFGFTLACISLGFCIGFRRGFKRCYNKLKVPNFSISLDSNLGRQVVSNLLNETLGENILYVGPYKIYQEKSNPGYLLQIDAVTPFSSEYQRLGSIYNKSMSFVPESLALTFIDEIHKFNGDKSLAEQYNEFVNHYIASILANVAFMHYEHLINNK